MYCTQCLDQDYNIFNVFTVQCSEIPIFIYNIPYSICMLYNNRFSIYTCIPLKFCLLNH